MEERHSSIGAGEVGSVGSDANGSSCVLPAGATATCFGVEKERLASGVPVISVTGELDLTTAPVLEEALVRPSYDSAGAVIVDLSGCGFIDLSGLRVLLAARERLERASRPLALVVANPSLLRIFELTGVVELFELYPSLAAATKVNGRG